MFTSDTPEQQDSQETMISSQQGRDLVGLIHPPGCSDPNCLLPECINIKLRKNHLQTCRKKTGRCDICRLLRSNLTDALVGPPSHQFVKNSGMKPKHTLTRAFSQNEDVNIVKVVKASDRQEKSLQGAQSSKQITTYRAVGEKPPTREYSSCSAVLPHGETVVNFRPEEQKHLGILQLSNKVGNDSIAMQGRNKVVQPPLEVLCNALQALNTVVQLVTASELEVHLIPILRQALAGMETAVIKRLEGSIGSRSLMLNSSPMVLDNLEQDATKPDDQWKTLLQASATPSSAPPSAPSSVRPSAPPPPPLSSSSPSSLSPSSSTSSPPWSPPPLPPPLSATSINPFSFSQERSSEYVPGVVNQWADHIPLQPPYKGIFNTNPVVEVYGGDLRSESQFDQDFILLDFVEELLG